jgi:hypothetical protein
MTTRTARLNALRGLLRELGFTIAAPSVSLPATLFRGCSAALKKARLAATSDANTPRW